MLAAAGGKPTTSPDWLYEIKYDGYRCMARVAEATVELRTKNGLDCTKWFPELACALEKVAGGPHVIDGEVCVLDDVGLSDFNRLQVRAGRRCWYGGCDSVTLCAFDLLFEDGNNIMGLPLVERKARLTALLDGVNGVRVVGDLQAQASLFARSVESPLLAELVAKRRMSSYQPGVRSPDWLKIKRAGPWAQAPGEK